MSTLSEKIKILLNNNEMTQKKLAEELHVSESAVQKWVVGRNAPSIFSIKEMSQIFCVVICQANMLIWGCGQKPGLRQ
ncbi:MAG: helix-turn-helix domain-containing protein [Eubacterium sp.]|jgi:DNA-binding transcriptional regulator YiaG|nr:helix-turn-helix domain-containing protein [Eubacterium sp.]MCH4045853.1 helix-turn-helix domain-containing protein [Eubacterium sp.]MCH4078944.1 helix-turn-helix domain-containing protein [Eubacterium sp.]